MTNAQFEVTVTSYLPDVIYSLEHAKRVALETLGLVCTRYAALNAPVDTGRLRNSITYKIVIDEEAVYVGTNVEYAPYVELGTSKRKPHPYIKPAVEDHKAEYKQIINDVFKKYYKF